MNRRWALKSGFSLIELVIVVVIIGLIAAMAIPRLSRGGRAAGDNSLRASLSTINKAIETYAAEHNGKYPDTGILLQLTHFSDITGQNYNPFKDVTNGIVYGPYLQAMPPMPVGSKKGKTKVFTTDKLADLPPQGAADEAWWYNTLTHQFKANLPASDVDDDNVAYTTY